MKLRAQKLARHIDKSYAVRNLIGIPISFVLMVLFYQAAMFAYYQFSPRTSFVDYKSEIAHQSGKTILFDVTRYTRKGVRLDFIDSLHCLKNDSYTYITAQTAKGFGRKTGVTSYKWQWEGATPDFTTKCYVQSLITANLPYGITKQQEVTTPPFKWVEED